MDAMQQLREQLTSKGLLPVCEPLLKYARPAIRIVTQQRQSTDLPVGSSKFGGAPDFPDAAVWPTREGRPMTMMAQIWMQDLPLEHVGDVLPSTGMLYFFFDKVDLGYKDGRDVPESWRVLYCDVDKAALRQVDQLVPDQIEYPQIAPLEFHPEYALPPYDSEEVAALELRDDEEDESESAYWEVVNEGVIHRLLGYSSIVQSDFRHTAVLAHHGLYLEEGVLDRDDPKVQALLPEVDDWILLFQIDDDYDNGAWIWGAGGRAFYIIRREDLAQRNFSNVWGSFETS